MKYKAVGPVPLPIGDYAELIGRATERSSAITGLSRA
jgi:hypothetical protein